MIYYSISSLCVHPPLPPQEIDFFFRGEGARSTLASLKMNKTTIRWVYYVNNWCNLKLRLRLHLFFSFKDQKINSTIWAEIMFFSLSHQDSFNRNFPFCWQEIFLMFSHQDACTSSVWTLNLRQNAEARVQMRNFYFILNTMSKIGYGGKI